MDFLLLALIIAVLGEATALVGTMMYGFTRAIPRAIKAGMADAEALLAKEKAAIKVLLHDIIGEYLNDVSIKAMAADAAKVLGDELGAKFGGKVAQAVGSMKRKASADPFGTIVDMFTQVAMQKFLPVDASGAGIPSDQPPLPAPHGLPYGV